MSRPRMLLVAALALPMAACVSLFPKGEPAQLYRFGDDLPAAAAVAGSPFAVQLGPVDFADAASGDRILSVTGGEAAYIANSRWVSPAKVLFEEAVAHAFQGSDGRARLVTRGESVKADYVLKLDVRRFETRYAYKDAAPQVLVEVRALLTDNKDRAVVGERVFSAEVPAAENRVSAIVAAYDQATDQVLGDLYAWVNSSPKSPAR